MPQCDYIIYQNALPAPEGVKPNINLPAALFTEVPGTTINFEGRILSFNKASEPFADSRADWWIMSGIAGRIKKGALKYSSLAGIQSEIKKAVPGFAGKDKKVPRKKVVMEGKAAEKAVSRKNTAEAPASFRGVPLHDHVAGMKAIEERRHK